MMLELGFIQSLPRIVCAQASNANLLYLSYKNGFKEFEPVVAKPTLATAIQIGNSVSASKAIAVLKAFDGIVEHATENELAHAVALADSTGLFSCPQTGVALAALLKLVERGTIAAQDRVVVLSTASGLKFIDFKTGYHTNGLPDVESHSVPPFGEGFPSCPFPLWGKVRKGGSRRDLQSSGKRESQ